MFLDSCDSTCNTGIPIGSNTDPLCFELPILGDKCCANLACIDQPLPTGKIMISYLIVQKVI